MDQREIRMRCLQLAASLLPKGEGHDTLKRSALDLERFVMTEGDADAVDRDLTEKRLQAERRMYENHVEVQRMLSSMAPRAGKP